MLPSLPRHTLSPVACGNGDNEIRTHDPLLARQVLSQLSYTPTLSLTVTRHAIAAPYLSPCLPARVLMGLSGLEPPTSRLSGVRSNRLSYKPVPFLF